MHSGQDAAVPNVPRSYDANFVKSELNLRDTEHHLGSLRIKTKLVPSRNQVCSEVIHSLRGEIITILCP